jgi:hypothetical protein
MKNPPALYHMYPLPPCMYFFLALPFKTYKNDLSSHVAYLFRLKLLYRTTSQYLDAVRCVVPFQAYLGKNNALTVLLAS